MPLTPKAETPARRGAPVRGQGRCSVSSSTAPAVQSTSGVGRSTCRVAGSAACRSAWTILITPPIPAAAAECPMLDFNEPSSSGRSTGRPEPYAASSACASMGSPSRVPVPCASTASTSAASSPASASAARITRSWARPLGAVRPLEAPSWLAAVPRTTASTRCPLRRASESRSSSTRPTPSAQPVPSAAAAKDLHRPSGASPRCREKSTKPLGVAMTVTPPARASDDSPSRSDRTARCSATRDEEQAVSRLTAGPSKPKVYAIRPEATLPSRPVSRCPSYSGGPASPRYVWPVTPAKTPTRPPRSVVTSMAACSNTSQAVSSSTRCCGSIAVASRGEMPKKSASKPVASATNPPSRVYEVPAVSGSGSYSPARSQPRSAGKGVTASRPAATRSHRSSGPATPPG